VEHQEKLPLIYQVRKSQVHIVIAATTTTTTTTTTVVQTTGHS
jgi:hypothetical protein